MEQMKELFYKEETDRFMRLGYIRVIRVKYFGARAKWIRLPTLSV